MWIWKSCIRGALVWINAGCRSFARSLMKQKKRSFALLPSYILSSPGYASKADLRPSHHRTLHATPDVAVRVESWCSTRPMSDYLKIPRHQAIRIQGTDACNARNGRLALTDWLQRRQ